MNHTRLPIEVHIPDWARRGKQSTKGNRVDYDNTRRHMPYVHNFNQHNLSYGQDMQFQSPTQERRTQNSIICWIYNNVLGMCVF